MVNLGSVKSIGFIPSRLAFIDKIQTINKLGDFLARLLKRRINNFVVLRNREQVFDPKTLRNQCISIITLHVHILCVLFSMIHSYSVRLYIHCCLSDSYSCRMEFTVFCVLCRRVRNTQRLKLHEKFKRVIKLDTNYFSFNIAAPKSMFLQIHFISSFFVKNKTVIQY